MAEKEKSRKYKGRTYTASKGSITALEDHDFDVSAAVDAGKFDWADEPYAAAQAAHIVAKGEPIKQEALIRQIVRNVLLEKKKAKKKKKKEVKCPLLPNGKRDYKCEYQKYGGASKKGKKDRAARNKARKQAEKQGLVKKGDGMEIDHIMPLSLGGSNDPKNWQVLTRADNRKKGKNWDGKSGMKNESLRMLIRELVLEAFTEEEVREKMSDDPKGRNFGAHAKDIFRQQREYDSEIDGFLDTVITIHWKRIQWTNEFSDELDYDILREPLQSTQSNDEISCSPYLPYDDGTPMAIEHRGWHNNDKLGIEVKGYISWLEHGDARTGHGFQKRGEEESPSGDNKQPRNTRMGFDPGKGDKMGDVIQSEDDFYKRKGKLSTYGDGEALVDNWEPVKVWYFEGDEMAAFQASAMLSKRFNKRIPYQTPQGTEQFGVEDFTGSLGDNPEEWSP